MAQSVGGNSNGALAASTFVGLGWLGKTCLVLGSTAVGGCCVLVARHIGRVVMARRQLRLLLADVAGEEARIVITGATNGIGLELARQLNRHPAVTLLLGCRDVARAERLFPIARQPPAQEEPELEGTARDSSAPAPLPKVRIVRLELLDLDSVQNFTDEAHDFLRGGGVGLRLLVNNAGIMRPPPGSSASGMDATWQTNFLAPFLLTELLARRRATDRVKHVVRVVQVSSRLERRSALSEELLAEVARGEPGTNPYADSKRALMLWTSVRAQSFAFRSSAFVHCATPGVVDSDLGRYAMSRGFGPAEGAVGVVAAALRPQAVEHFGRYYDGERQLEDLVLDRMGEKKFANALVKWATERTALDAR
eukprot:CAMPEP_0170214150 /NCGR_PEP_ID=MMETSP0116_2-20130129/6702_1 /TAXON_ID=400756 /ORGANISM="Durinskia baltica, Strain CSIRO CS-38" /LENGTH=365 /DNA_ID=CAMNT_0010464707 /DNA_START=86 /DNA_END=1180 /DNA_ORIENTATION=-